MRGGLRRHPEDRAIFALAVPALGALAADPLYSLVDTAFVGNLGTPQLGALAVGTAAFTASFWLFSFLAYGVTPRVARAFGSNDSATAGRVGMQALWLAVLIGCAVTVAGIVLAGPVVRILGASGAVEGHAEPYLRIRMLSATPVLIAQVGHGWLRGAQDTRTPMYIAVGGAVLNVGLDYVLIYPAGWGIHGAAWATVVGQTLAAGVFVTVLARRIHGAPKAFDPRVARSLLTVGVHLAIRTGSLLAALTIATSVAARMGEIPLASWQITMQVFLFLALTLDSIAIAGQALVGRRLGAEDTGAAFDVGRRLMILGVVLGLALLGALLVAAAPVARLFSRDGAVVEGAQDLLVWLALVQPLAAAAFTLDGILIGASDTRFLAVSMAAASAAFVAVSGASLALEWGTVGLAAGATVWLALRTATTGARFARGAWAT